MSDIPQAKRLLGALIQHLRENGDAEGERRARDALSLMTRRKYAREAAPVKSRFVDGNLAEALRRYARAHPGMSLQEIATHFRTNAGRVSESLHRLR